MKVTADLHLHSKYSRATSKQLDIVNLEKWAKVKGINLLGTGDFTHPEWIKELKANLSEDGSGILKTKNGFNFILQAEVSLIYSQGGKGRRVHNVLLAPDFDVVKQVTEYFLKHGRVDYDGRPIFKIPCDEMTYELKKISDDIEVIPAHVWTPWFSLFGSMSGFDDIEEAFKEQTKNIFALETGLSSDPPMNWRLSKLDRFALVSCSDSHSFWPWRIGREATMFELKELTYKNLIKALRTKEGLLGTIEVDPAYGKYHFDGHRNCKVCLSPKESLKLKNICPVCGNQLTIGVEHRVEALADREEGFKPKGAKDFKRLIPLSEIISSLIGKAAYTKAVWAEFHKLVRDGKSELDILLETPFEELKKAVDEKTAKAIIDSREGKIKVKPGYDGEYGAPLLGGKPVKEEKIPEPKQKQTGLNQFLNQ
ncbi:endonuclease Q family protein [Candidatus Woesearchaeota archaeon]|nr:endonuclease Q family protein [Candidatus Woesearchaeota archaeon]